MYLNKEAGPQGFALDPVLATTLPKMLKDALLLFQAGGKVVGDVISINAAKHTGREKWARDEGQLGPQRR